MTRQDAIKKGLWIPLSQLSNPYLRAIRDSRLGITPEGLICTFTGFSAMMEAVIRINGNLK